MVNVRGRFWRNGRDKPAGTRPRPAMRNNKVRVENLWLLAVSFTFLEEQKLAHDYTRPSGCMSC